MESEIISMNFSFSVTLKPIDYRTLYVDRFSVDDFIISCAGHLANIGSHIPNVAAFDDTKF